MTLKKNNTFHSIETAQQDGRLRQAQLKMLGMLEIIDSICSRHGLDYWLDGGTLLGAIRHQGFIPWDDDLDISMPRASYEQFLRIAPAEIPASMWLQTAQTDKGYFNLVVPLKIRDCHSRFIEQHEQGNESYHQGIFIDVFVYDALPASALQRKFYKLAAKKILRLLSPKYSTLVLGHRTGFYKLAGKFLPKVLLEKILQYIMHKANTSNSGLLGCGYDCVNSSLVTHDTVYPLKRAPFETGQFNIVNKPELILTQLYGDYLSLPPKSQQVMKHCKELIPELSE